MNYDNLRICLIADATEEGFFEAFRLYEASFPPGERENLAVFRNWLGTTGLHEKYPVNFMEVARIGDCVVGMALVHYIETLDAAFIGYIAVDPKYRGHGIGKAIIRQITEDYIVIHSGLSTKQPLGLFAEIEYLKHGSSERLKRLLFWEHLGYYRLQLAYRYPVLTPGTKPSGVYLIFKSTKSGVPPFTRQEASLIIQEIFNRVYSTRICDDELKQVLKSISQGPSLIGIRQKMGVLI